MSHETPDSTENSENTRQCPKCGASLPADAPDDLCPQCLMKAGLQSEDLTQTVDYDPDSASNPPQETSLPTLGSRFGNYQIIRQLGRGGMGVVYEADDVESGRRVALKVLSHALDSPRARKRFIREGRIAASINHPNSVYVYGTEEINETPVIAMELVSGGTLDDRVKTHGALPIGDAVDVMMQVIDGLESAATMGILHRDIKPSNCFVDQDGSVKVGDFGLSISTEGRGETHLTIAGSLLGTPAFSSPEQLRGEELNVRSDIYAVGVTLYYLLTGHTPFKGENVVQLLATVLEQQPESPNTHRNDLPRDLGRVVMRCLAKQPGDRYRDYAELRRALLPFTSTAPMAAHPGMRILAGLLDGTMWGVFISVLQALLFGGFAAFTEPELLAQPGRRVFAAAGFVAYVLYFAISESTWGCSIGKAICGLRVTMPNGDLGGVGRLIVRAMIILLIPSLPMMFYLRFDYSSLGSPHITQPDPWFMVVTWSYYLILIMLFSTVRKRNGYAGVHELITNTRVIRKPKPPVRPVLSQGVEEVPSPDGATMTGPYHVLDTIDKTDDHELILAYDTRLLRRVWVRNFTIKNADEANKQSAMVGRPGRLRWINGKRTASERWDAYEAITGSPLLKLLGSPLPWASVRFWLLDLAEELHAASNDGSLPVLSIDRVWITADGRAKLLDFPAPGTTSNHDFQVTENPQLFLKQVAMSALTGRACEQDITNETHVPVALPLHAQTLFGQLPLFQTLDQLITNLKPATNKTATISRARRAVGILLLAVFPVLVAAFGLFSQQAMKRWSKNHPEIQPMSHCMNLLYYSDMSRNATPETQERHERTKRLYTIYLATHYRDTINDPETWKSQYSQMMIQYKVRTHAEEILKDFPEPTAEEIKEADEHVGKELEDFEKFNFMGVWWFPYASAAGNLFLFVMIPGILCALAFRGGPVIHMLGIAAVRKDGHRASRLRMFCRSLVAWSPIWVLPFAAAFILPLIAMFSPSKGYMVPIIFLLLIVCPLIASTVFLRGRTIQDRLAGTWLVPK